MKYPYVVFENNDMRLVRTELEMRLSDAMGNASWAGVSAQTKSELCNPSVSDNWKAWNEACIIELVRLLREAAKQ